jgi:hypothetical protein
MADLTHLDGRIAVDSSDDRTRFGGWGGLPVPRHIHAWHHMWAAEYLHRLQSGDTGAAFNYLNDLRHGTSAVYVDPWWLLQLVAERALKPAAEPGETVAAPQAVPSAQPGTG